jgi:uncharacterized protein (DUF4415 family)
MAKKPNLGLIDDDASELTDPELAEMRPARQLLPSETLTRAKPGRPPQPDRKIAIKLRLDPDVVVAFRATGEGWQTRINDALQRAVKSHTRLHKFRETTPMIVQPKSQNAVVEILSGDPATPSHRVAAELRRRGLEVPARPILQALCSTARKALKKSR